jgi:Cu+-exporting ATPase
MNDGHAHHTHHHDVAEAPDPQDIASDPVWGMKVNKATAKHRSEHAGQP